MVYLGSIPRLDLLAVAFNHRLVLASHLFQDLPQVWSRAGIDFHIDIAS